MLSEREAWLEISGDRDVGLCLRISDLKCDGLIDRVTAWSMQAKIDVLPTPDTPYGDAGYKWGWDREGKAQRKAFCLQQAELLAAEEGAKCSS